jgi:hypothetical protein
MESGDDLFPEESMRRFLLSILILCLSASVSHAVTYFSCDGNRCGVDWSNYYGSFNYGVSDSTAPDGNGVVWRWTLPPGSPAGSGIATVWPNFGFSGANEMWVQYYWKNSSNWVYNGVVDKHFYFNPSNTIVGFRSGGDRMCISPQGGPQAYNHCPNEYTTEPPFYQQRNAWHKMKAYIKLNTNTSPPYNGVFKLWIDDEYVTNRTLAYSGSGSEVLSNFHWAVIWGGVSGTIPSTQYFYIDDIYIGSTEPGGGTTGDTLPPYTSNISPAKSATGVPKTNRTISLNLTDKQNDQSNGNVDSSTITLTVEGTDYTCASAELTCTGGDPATESLTYTNASDWSYSQVVNVSVTASDTAATPNTLYESWSYTIESDPTPPTSGTDNFNRANETPLQSPWTQQPGTFNMNLSGNAVVGASSWDQRYYHSTVTPSADQYSRIEIVDKRGVGVDARMQTDAESGYTCYHSSSANEMKLYKTVNGTETLLVDWTAVTLSATDNVEIRAEGTNISCWYDTGSGMTKLMEAANQTDFASGKVGIHMNGTLGSLDNWAGGDLAVSTLEVTTTSLPNGTVGVPYSQQLSATGGVSCGDPAYSWSVVSGTLPVGLSLSTGGAFSGSPTTAETQAFTVEATDCAGSPATDNQALSLTINPAPVPSTYTTTLSIAGGEDTFVNYGAATTNYYDNTASKTYQWPIATVANRTLYKIDISSLPANVQITKCELNQYLTMYEGSGGTNPMKIHAYPVTGGTWAIDNVTWNNFDGTLGTKESTTEVSLTSGFFRFDITNICQSAYSGSTNVVVALDGGNDGAQDTNRTFASGDHGTSAFRPFLGINYTQQDPGGGTPLSAPGRWQISIGNMNFY